MGQSPGQDPDLRALEDLLRPQGRRRRTADEAPAADDDLDGSTSEEPEPAAPRSSRGGTDPERPQGSPALEDAGPDGPRARTPEHGAGHGPDGAATDPVGLSEQLPPTTRRPTSSGEGPAPQAALAARDAAALEAHGAPAPASRGAVAFAARDAAASASREAVALAAHDPALGLTERLREDKAVTVPVRPWPRLAAVAVAALALTLWLLALRAAAAGAPWPRAGLSAATWAFLVAVSAVAAYVAMWRLWPARVLRLHLADDQKAQLAIVEAQALAARRMVWGGAGAAVVGVLVLGAAFAWAGAGQRGVVQVFACLLAAGGLVAAAAGLARLAPLRLLYAQTLVLHRLETLGAGDRLVTDPRITDVLLELDALLGGLPESAVRRFLSRPEADWYLMLIAKLKEERRGR